MPQEHIRFIALADFIESAFSDLANSLTTESQLVADIFESTFGASDAETLYDNDAFAIAEY